MRKYQVRFWRAAALVRESPTLIVIRHATPTRIPSGWLSIVKAASPIRPMTSDANPDTTARSVEPMLKPTCQ
jgi:hypothetical protein